MKTLNNKNSEDSKTQPVFTQTQQLVLNYFSDKNNANSNVELIESCIPSLNKLTILKTLKLLSEKGLLTKSDTIPPVYNIAVIEEIRKTNIDQNIKKEKKVKEVDEVKLKGGRNTDKYTFNNQSFSKSRLVLEVLKLYVAENLAYSLEEIQATWKSEELQKRYGTIVELSKAKKFCEGGRERHFMKDTLTIGNKRVCVCNQWSEDLLLPFLKIAESLNYHIHRQG